MQILPTTRALHYVFYNCNEYSVSHSTLCSSRCCHHRLICCEGPPIYHDPDCWLYPALASAFRKRSLSLTIEHVGGFLENRDVPLITNLLYYTKGIHRVSSFPSAGHVNDATKKTHCRQGSLSVGKGKKRVLEDLKTLTIDDCHCPGDLLVHLDTCHPSRCGGRWTYWQSMQTQARVHTHINAHLFASPSALSTTCSSFFVSPTWLYV